MEGKTERRGRPSLASSDPDQKPRKFTREFKEYSGHRSVWTYDLDITEFGPIMVEEFYPPGSEESKTEDPTSENIPKTKRKYINPINDKLVGYMRYCMIMKELGKPLPK